MKNFSEQDKEQLQHLIRSCVHCGFCNATCPSYKVLGNELDGPRGRIYQIADLVSGQTNDRIVLQHLDSCLECRNCETTCPSDVEYSKIISLGKKLALEQFGRSLLAKLQRKVLVHTLVRPNIATILFTTLSRLRFLMPARLRKSIPKRERELPLIQPIASKQLVNQQRILLLGGCVQPGLRPNTNRYLHNLLARLGFQLDYLPIQICCGALPHHNDHEKHAISLACRIIDTSLQMFSEAEKAHIPYQGIAMTSSACVLELQQFPWLLRHLPGWKDRAEDFASRVIDISALLTSEHIASLDIDAEGTVAFHPPCTLQHGQGSERIIAIDAMLQATGLTLVPIAQRHLCCGSAGTYSVMQPKVAKCLRDDKITALTFHQPDYVATANIGCQVYLQEGLGDNTYMWHWVELIEHLANKAHPLYA